MLLSAVSGHRDTGLHRVSRGCPLRAARRDRRVGASARRPQDLRAEGDGERRRRSAFARGSRRRRAWTVAVTGAGGRRGRLAAPGREPRSTGRGSRPGRPRARTRGRSRPAPHARRRASLRAGGGTPPLAIESARREPEAISPNGDGQADATTLTYRISAAANVTVEVTDAIGGVVATVVDRVWTAAGEHTVERRRRGARRRRRTTSSSPRGPPAGVSVQKRRFR